MYTDRLKWDQFAFSCFHNTKLKNVFSISLSNVLYPVCYWLGAQSILIQKQTTTGNASFLSQISGFPSLRLITTVKCLKVEQTTFIFRYLPKAGFLFCWYSVYWRCDSIDKVWDLVLDGWLYFVSTYGVVLIQVDFSDLKFKLFYFFLVCGLEQRFFYHC